MIGDVLALLAANGCFLAAGVGLGRALGVWTSRADLVGAVGLLYMLGVAVCGSLAAFALIAGLSLELWQVLVGCGLLALTGLARGGGSMLRPALPRPRDDQRTHCVTFDRPWSAWWQTCRTGWRKG